MSDGLTHLDSEGRAHMVDVGAKAVTLRVCVARGAVRMTPDTLRRIHDGSLPKGDVLATARLAGIQAAKRTSDWIPLCHSLPLTHADVRITLEEDGAKITATASTSAQTGVEMEALTAVSVAALTLYDMLKAIDRGMVISDIRLERKSGGRSGEWKREG